MCPVIICIISHLALFQASGKKADFTSKTESFVRAFGRPERNLGVEWWAAISSETFGKLKFGHAGVHRPRQNGRVEQRCEAQLLQQRVPHENPGAREGSPSNHGSACACWVSSIAPAQRWFLTRNTSWTAISVRANLRCACSVTHLRAVAAWFIHTGLHSHRRSCKKPGVIC